LTEESRIWGVQPTYAILLSHGKSVKCKDCGGEGTLPIHGSIKTCRSCGGLGRVPLLSEAYRVLRGFRLPEHYTVTYSESVLIKFSRYHVSEVYMGYDIDEVIHSLFALAVSGIKARIVFPVF